MLKKNKEQKRCRWGQFPDHESVLHPSFILPLSLLLGLHPLLLRALNAILWPWPARVQERPLHT